MTRTRAAQVVSLACAHHVSCVILIRSCVCFDSLRLLHFPLFAVHLLSYRPVFPSGHQLHLPRCGGQIPCALQLMRTLAPLPSTTLSQRMYYDSTTNVEFGGTTRGQFFIARGVRQRLSCQRLLVCDGFPPFFFDGVKMRSFQGSLLAWTFYSRLNVRMRCGFFIFSGLNDRVGTSISLCGPYCWAQFDLAVMLLGATWS